MSIWRQIDAGIRSFEALPLPCWRRWPADPGWLAAKRPAGAGRCGQSRRNLLPSPLSPPVARPGVTATTPYPGLKSALSGTYSLGQTGYISGREGEEVMNVAVLLPTARGGRWRPPCPRRRLRGRRWTPPQVGLRT